MACPICRHPERTAIEIRIASGASVRTIASEYGKTVAGLEFTYGVVQAHKRCMAGGRPPTPIPHNPVPQLPLLPPIVPAPPPFPKDGTPLEQVRWLLATTSEILGELRAKGQEVSLQAVKRLETQVALLARLQGQLVERHEVTGPGGGPLQLQALVGVFPASLQPLVQAAEAGDAQAALRLDHYSRTGEESLQGQIRATRQLLAELEAEAANA